MLQIPATDQAGGTGIDCAGGDPMARNCKNGSYRRQLPPVHVHLSTFNVHSQLQNTPADFRRVGGRERLNRGQYGGGLDKLVMTVDTATNDVTAVATAEVVDVGASTATPDPAVAALVSQAVADSDVPAAATRVKLLNPQFAAPDDDTGGTITVAMTKKK
jgi:hypothetical protein